MISVFLIENYPWVIWTEFGGDMLKIGRWFGEWAWVGRVDN